MSEHSEPGSSELDSTDVPGPLFSQQTLTRGEHADCGIHKEMNPVSQTPCGASGIRLKVLILPDLTGTFQKECRQLWRNAFSKWHLVRCQ